MQSITRWFPEGIPEKEVVNRKQYYDCTSSWTDPAFLQILHGPVRGCQLADGNLTTPATVCVTEFHLVFIPIELRLHVPWCSWSETFWWIGFYHRHRKRGVLQLCFKPRCLKWHVPPLAHLRSADCGPQSSGPQSGRNRPCSESALPIICSLLAGYRDGQSGFPTRERAHCRSSQRAILTAVSRVPTGEALLRRSSSPIRMYCPQKTSGTTTPSSCQLPYDSYSRVTFNFHSYGCVTNVLSTVVFSVRFKI